MVKQQKIQLIDGNYTPLEEIGKINEIIEELNKDSGSGLQLFDLTLKDHVLAYEELKGYAALGSYVYKDAVAGSRYGYPDFYQRVLDEKAQATSETLTVSGTVITVYRNSNGHVFYNISDKATIDSLYSGTGVAWYYGVDEENERVFLPRNDYYFKSGNVSNLGKYVPPSLPNIKGAINVSQDSMRGGDADSALYTTTRSSGATTHNNANTSGIASIELDASRHSSIYQDGATVNPPAVNVVPYMVVGNVSDWVGMTDVVNQGMEILEQVNQGIESRANIDLSNLSSDGKATAASMAMPSGKIVGLTVGASGALYTAPADGYFRVSSMAASNSQGWIYMSSSSGLTNQPSNSANNGLNGFLPCKKGDEVTIQYFGLGNTPYFGFIYAKGAESEAE